MKPESTARVIAKYGPRDELMKSTISAVLCLVFRGRVKQCFEDVFRDQQKGPVYSERKIKMTSTRSLIQSVLYLQ